MTHNPAPNYEMSNELVDTIDQIKTDTPNPEFENEHDDRTTIRHHSTHDTPYPYFIFIKIMTHFSSPKFEAGKEPHT